MEKTNITQPKPSTKLFVGAYVPAAEPFPILIACARDAEGREYFCGLYEHRIMPQNHDFVAMILC